MTALSVESAVISAVR